MVSVLYASCIRVRRYFLVVLHGHDIELALLICVACFVAPCSQDAINAINAILGYVMPLCDTM